MHGWLICGVNCDFFNISDNSFGLGEEFAIYVINKQSHNRQLWLSSPSSGPTSRFDWDLERQVWVYKHTGETLLRVSDRELGEQLEKRLGLKEMV